jgi:hypothetical protein
MIRTEDGGRQTALEDEQRFFDKIEETPVDKLLFLLYV